MNFWVSKMLKKPIEQFPNPKLINFNGEEKQFNIKEEDGIFQLQEKERREIKMAK